jgi:hypothetical protein
MLIINKTTAQMIIGLVASPSKPYKFVYAARMMAPRRQAILKDYDPEINALYYTVEKTSQVDNPIPTGWTPSQSIDYRDT